MPIRIARVFHFPTNYVIAKPRSCPTCTGQYIYINLKAPDFFPFILDLQINTPQVLKTTAPDIVTHKSRLLLKPSENKIPLLHNHLTMSDQNSSSLKGYVDSAVGGVQSAIGSLTGDPDHQVSAFLPYCAALSRSFFFLEHTLASKALSPPPCPTLSH